MKSHQLVHSLSAGFMLKESKQHILRHFKRLCSNFGVSDIWSLLVVSVSDISLYLVNFYVVSTGWTFGHVYRDVLLTFVLEVAVFMCLLVKSKWTFL